MSTDANGRILYTASADATIRSWNISQGQVLKVKVLDSLTLNINKTNLTVTNLLLIDAVY